MSNKDDLLKKNLHVSNITTFIEEYKIRGDTQELEIAQSRAQRYSDKFNQVVPDLAELSANQKKFLIQSFDVLKSVSNNLSPLKGLGVSYSLSLAGGAVRDFLFDRISDINDVDVYLFMGNKDINIMQRSSGVKNSVDLSINDAQVVLGKSDLNASMLQKKEDWLDYSVSSLMAKSFNIHNKFYETDVSREYLESSIKSIFKMHSKNLNTNSLKCMGNIDLILTQSPIRDFITLFDFEICKTYFDFRPNDFTNIKKNLSSEEDFLHRVNAFSDDEKIQYMYSKLRVFHSCLKDMVEKTLTINLQRFPKEHVDYFLNKHYLKMVEKFPEYEFKTQDLVLENNPEVRSVLKKAYNLKLEHLLNKREGTVVKKHKL